MQKQFDTVLEHALNRFTNGGLLVGDLVKFKKDWAKHKDLESQHEVLMQIRSMIEQGYNLRVTNLANRFPAVMGGDNTDYSNPARKVATVAQEIAPGRYYNYVSLPADLLEPVDTYPNLPPIPDKMVRPDKSHIKQKEFKAPGIEDKASTSPGRQTRGSDHGDQKIQKGDRELTGKNVKIPSKPAKDAADPASYTYRYLPKR